MAKILIGLRNQVYADYIGYCLRMQGQDVKVVAGGMDIVHLLFSQNWDIAIIGIHVSYYNGLEILDKYRKYCHEMVKEAQGEVPVKTKIYIVSGFYDRVSLQQAKNLGAADCFVVPQDTDTFLNQVLKKESL